MRAQNRAVIVAVAVYAVALTVGCLMSNLSTPAFWELERLRSVARGAELVWNVAEFGPSVFGSSSARAIYDEVAAHGTVAVLASSWAHLSLAKVGLLDALTAQRIGFIAIVATVPPALFLIAERAAGLLAGVVAASLLLGSPHWLHQSGLGAEAAVTTACWFLVLAGYVRSLQGSETERRPACWGAICGLALGFGAALSLSVLWIVPAILCHYWARRPRQLRQAIRSGRVPAPAAAVWSLGTVPLCLALLAPQLWAGGAKQAAAWLLANVRPEVDETLYLGEWVSSPPVPLLFAVHWLLVAVPFVILVLAVVGAISIFHQSHARAKVTRSPGVALGRLLVILTFGGLASVALTPALLIRFPPRTVALVPVLSLLAAVGLLFLAQRFAAEQYRSRIVAGATALCVVFGTLSPATAGASFNWLAGGPEAVAAEGDFALTDGSELGEVARFIDELGRSSVNLYSPDTPKGYWNTLRKLGRLRTETAEVTRTEDADFVIVQGAAAAARYTVARGGAVLWSVAEP